VVEDERGRNTAVSHGLLKVKTSESILLSPSEGSSFANLGLQNFTSRLRVKLFLEDTKALASCYKHLEHFGYVCTCESGHVIVVGNSFLDVK
jgi:hypothetical protein